MDKIVKYFNYENGNEDFTCSLEDFIQSRIGFNYDISNPLLKRVLKLVKIQSKQLLILFNKGLLTKKELFEILEIECEDPIESYEIKENY